MVGDPNNPIEKREVGFFRLPFMSVHLADML